MPKSRRKPLAPPQNAAERETADYGPKEQRWRVVIRHRGDPDRPVRTIRRAEVRVIYHGLWAEGLLTDAQHESADRLSIAYEAAQGSRTDSGGGIAAWQRTTLAERMVQAAADLRTAREALGMPDYLFALAVCAANRWHAGPDLPRLSRCLTVLATRWRME